MVCTRSGTVKKLGVRTPRKCKERPATKITQKSARAAKKLTPKKSEDPLEIMAMVALYSYPRQCLSKKEICDAIRERFDNLPTTRFVTRVTAALRSSTIFEEIHNFNGSRGPGWKFTNKNLGAMKKLVDAFVDKNPDLARTHRIEKSDSDKRGSPASAAPLVQLPATVPKIHAKPLRGRGKTVQGTGSMDDVTPDDNNALVVANHVEADKPMEQEHAPVQRVAVKQEIEGEADDSMNEDYPPVQRVTVKREADESMEVELVGLSEMVGDTLIIGHPNGKKYVVKDTIGQGSFGQVHLVTNRNEGKFALKVSPVDEGNTTEDDFYKKVLKAERCRFIAAKYPLFKTRLEGVIQRCEIMDLYGRDLYDVLFTDAVSFTPLQILEFVFQLTTALQHIDKMGYIHADIKPENLMLVNYDPERTHQPYHLPIEVRLIDFNSMMDKDNDEPFGFVGQSVPYRAPEMALEMPCDQRIDVWSAGVCAMQMLDRDFIVIGDEEVAPFGEGEQRSAAILGEIERVFGSIPAHMKKMSRFHNFCEKASFPSILNRDGIYCNLNNSLHKHLPGDSRTEDKLKAILKRMLRVDVDKRRFAYEIREDLELFLDA